MKPQEKKENPWLMESSKGLFWRLTGVATLLSLALYGWIVLRGYFFSDDFTWLWFGQKIIQDPGQLWTLKAGSFFSPVMNAYYSILLFLFGPAAPVYFFINLLVHIGVSVLIGLLAFSLSRSRLAAWIAMGFVACAGGAYEPLIWIGANMHSFVTLFILVALYGYSRFLETKQSYWLFLSVIGQILAYGTKETSIVVAPLLALLYLNARFFHKIQTNWKHWVFVACALLGAMFYAGLQYILQESGKTFSVNQYQIGWSGLLRYPFVLADLFVPILPLRTFLTVSSATAIGLVLSAAFGWILWKMRHIPGMLFAAAMMVLGSLPPLFFTPRDWWEPLASRYEYLPRTGAALALSLVLVHLIRMKSSRWIIGLIGASVCVTTLLQFGFFMRSIRVDYAYIYRSGRTLAEAATQMKTSRAVHVFVHPPFPFGQNHAHIIGALIVLAQVKEENITFLAESDQVPLDDSHQLLYWVPKKQSYETTNNSSIYHRFPLP